MKTNENDEHRAIVYECAVATTQMFIVWLLAILKDKYPDFEVGLKWILRVFPY